MKGTKKQDLPQKTCHRRLALSVAGHSPCEEVGKWDRNTEH